MTKSQEPTPPTSDAITRPDFRDRIRELREVELARITDFSGTNPKQQSTQFIAQLDASLIKNGYAKPMLVVEAGDKFMTLDGHTRRERIHALWPHVQRVKVLILDVENEAEGKLLIMGLMASGEFDMDALDSWMRAGLADGLTGEDIASLTGFTGADLDVLAELEADLAKATSGEEIKLEDDPEPEVEKADDIAAPLSPTERAAQIFIFEKKNLAEVCFKHYRTAGFPYPNPSPIDCMLAINKLASMSMETLLRTHEGGSVADKFQPHRFEAVADGMISPFAAFSDDKKLRYVIDMIIDSTGTIGDGTLRSMLGMLQGAQSCSNFRPGFAAYLYRRFVPPGGVIFDTSAGFGGRLVGALASTVASRYIGIDPNKPSIEGSKKLLALLGKNSFAEFAIEPAEDIEHERWAEAADFMFTSPPYFNKERYSDAPTQSGVRYPKADDWREKFLLPMLELTFATLKPGAHAGINIADSLVDGVRHPLGDWTVACAKRAGFEHIGTLDFPIGGSRNFGNMKGTAKQEEGGAEPIFLFRKPADAPLLKKKTRKKRT